MVDKGIIRNKLKIKAAINNASIFLKIQKEYENFKNYILKLTKGKIIYECDKTTNKVCRFDYYIFLPSSNRSY